MIYERTNFKKLEDKQLTTDLINHHRKQQEYFGRKKKDFTKSKAHKLKAAAETLNLNF